MSEAARESVALQLQNLSEADSEPEVSMKTKSRPRSTPMAGRNGENIPLMSSCTSGGQSGSDEDGRNVFEDREFAALVRAGEEAINNGTLPQRISQGSSGSYFVRNIDEVRLDSTRQ